MARIPDEKSIAFWQIAARRARTRSTFTAGPHSPTISRLTCAAPSRGLAKHGHKLSMADSGAVNLLSQGNAFAFDVSFLDLGTITVVDMNATSSTESVGITTLTSGGPDTYTLAFAISAGVDFSQVASVKFAFAEGTHTDARFQNFVIIPLPPTAWAGLSTLAGVGLVGVIRRRRFSAAV